MLDIKFIRENIKLIKKVIKDKKSKVDLEELLLLDLRRRTMQKTIDDLKRKKKKESSQDNKENGKLLKNKISTLEKEYKDINEQYILIMEQVPNIYSDDTPLGENEDENVIIKVIGDIPEFDFKAKEHWELGTKLGMINIEKAAKISGSRFSYIMGDLVKMQFGLINFVFDILTSKKILKNIIEENELQVASTPFIPVIPPVFIKPDIMNKMARLKPEDDRYHTAKDDLYLIGSAEHTLGPLHMDELLKEKDLPIRYVGYSTAFRREAGSYGKDVKGILRQHQFDKIEMESFSLSDKSLEEQDFFVAIQEYIVQQLEIPYQVVQICTGDMGGPDYRQIDIECWMPGQEKYRETHTSDLMCDYQSRRLNTKVLREDGSKEFVHMNDATAVAIGRLLIAIMENYQKYDGTIAVPKLLQKYVGKKVIGK